MMRTDEADLILGQRLNVWTSIVVFSWACGSSGSPVVGPVVPSSSVGEPESHDVG